MTSYSLSRHVIPSAVHVWHEMLCEHQIEVEVWPENAELYFQDERFVDPVNTQVRFDAVVYNGSTSKVTWTVQDLAGNSGAGSIDPAGLYVAPPKGSLPHGLTDVVVATPVENPLRKAFAFVTLIGRGPEPVSQPSVEIFPKRIDLYYPQGHDNSYIDASNTMQMFRAFIRDSSSQTVEWLVDHAVQPGAGPDPWFLYQVTGSGSLTIRTVTVRLQSHPTVQDEAKVIQMNYDWPGLV